MMDHLEIAHNSDSSSGYGTMVRQMLDGMREIGQEFAEIQGEDIFDQMIHAPKEPVLRRVSLGGDGPGVLRWMDRKTGARVTPGTQYRRWVSDQDLPEWYGTRDPIPREPTTRPGVVRICPDVAENSQWHGADIRVLMTMWESSELPDDIRPWAPHLRRADLVIVPCEHSRRLVLSVAPDVRCRVVPLAIDPEKWPLLERSRPDDATYVFVMTGDLSKRKGIDLAYGAFRSEFGPDDKAALVFKARGMSHLCDVRHTPKYVPLLDDDGAPVMDERNKPLMVWNKDRREYLLQTPEQDVMTLRGNWSKAGLRKLYQRADCFLWPSRGEGWGYPPREAAATGLPVITATHTGMADAAYWAVRLLPHFEGTEKAYYQNWGESGHWFQPDAAALAASMRWCYENRAEALERARQASRYLHQRTPADLARDILQEIEELRDERNRENGDGSSWCCAPSLDYEPGFARRNGTRVPDRA